MKHVLLFLSLLIGPVPATTAQTGYPIEPVPFTSVKVDDGSFWGQRLATARRVTVPLAFAKCEETGRYKNFENAATHLKDPSKVFPVGGFSFDDTDPYKTIEGASYLLSAEQSEAARAKGGRKKGGTPQPLIGGQTLRNYVDSVIDIIATAQEPDGYLYTARTQNPQHPHDWAGDRRWVKDEDLSHELYCLGHMVEGAIAHYQATGSRRFLDIAIRYADCVCREVGPAQGQACVVPGHQIAEMALAKLYLVTGDKKYLDEAKFFLDYRGRTTITHDYSQAHKPVTEQDEAVGHAVRAAYMYAGMADVAALTGDTAYIAAIDRIWENIVGKKLYITGGIGSTSAGEAFGRNYELPNMTAYCETCAAIGLCYVNHRLFLLHGQAKYYDVLERTLYNGLLSGYSLTGDGFFYPNPLASAGQHERKPWFGCACCPSNICRFIPSLPGYVYAVASRRSQPSEPAHSVYVNMFVPGTATLTVGGKSLTLSQTTNYPWDGETTITVGNNSVGSFCLKIRIPGWLRSQTVPSDLYHYADEAHPGYSVSINGVTVPLLLSPDGYVNIDRRWKKGDEVLLHFDMEPRVVQAHERVAADRGMVAVERGPLVYCAEHPDNGFDLTRFLMPQKPVFAEGEAQIAGTPVVTLTTDVQTIDGDPNHQGAWRFGRQRLTLIPYYAWCHRGKGQMRVWLPQTPAFGF